ncbi:tryptophanyl-tRNA synthetase [Sistotremastrum suecicum HHB10207 ss-3]|uniref:tryptophan--tRNA ligase n=1 Tax=Sistotremastrum suecicum HHB10207 ss-3 TaxID=1314776 RepID=A0A166BFS3_9AGAM|nr:tryptophanyl-tRNA synthetase [Sistotremastrum suecicum HHB10207 ss-3]
MSRVLGKLASMQSRSVLQVGKIRSGLARRSLSTDQTTQRHPRTIFSGIQPSGIPHLGNYLGALSHWVELQKTAVPGDRLFFSVVDLHALTVQRKKDAPSVRDDAETMTAALLAIGLDPSRCTIFCQSHVAEHLHLAWLLSCITSMGRLNRMTTWKGKLVDARNANSEAEIDESHLNVGLFTYPVLQSADILLYRATHVPVGEDQRQHIELCRDIAQILNARLQESLRPDDYERSAFRSPELLITSYKRILSLRDPNQKMSKSSPDLKSRILLTDSTDEIYQKIRGAVTDSQREITFSPEARPGVSNLLTILAGCTGENVFELAEKFGNAGHGELKKTAMEAVEETMKGPRSEYLRLLKDRTYIQQVLRDGTREARKTAQQTMREITDTLQI